MAEIKHLVRIANTDLPGGKSVLFALSKIKGVSVPLANALCAITGVDKTAKLGAIGEADVKKLNEAVKSLDKLPTWMYNRQKDYETGEDTHLIGADLTYTQDNDLKRLKKIKSNRGLRHQWGLPVRGQQTKSNHRRTKAKNSAAAKKGKKKA